MPDAIFDDPRLAVLYDPLDPDRSDLDPYLDLLTDVLLPGGTGQVLDVGCGTGTFALLLTARGVDVTGLDPARASVEVARGKPGAERVRWLVGTVPELDELLASEELFDAATMTANVAQVFCTDADWAETLAGIAGRLRPGGWLVFEARRPEARAWQGWTREQTTRQTHVTGTGWVGEYEQVTGVDGELVSFDGVTSLLQSGQVLHSSSTLRFRGRVAIEDSLSQAGLDVVEVRDAPDRPGREWVYLARRRLAQTPRPGRREPAGSVP